MTRDKKLILWTVLIISLTQMIGAVIAPAMNIIKTTVFAQEPLSKIQTVMALTGLVSPAAALLSAEMIRRGLVTKKGVVVTGLFTLGAAGLLAVFLHTRLWHVGLISFLTGIASGFYLSTVLSIMMDKLTPGERQNATGLQSVFVNLGGFLISAVGGVLATWHWYGGYLILLVGIPIGMMAIFTLPTEKRTVHNKQKDSSEKVRFDSIIFFYVGAVLVFMLLFSVLNSNIAIHMALSGFENPALVGIVTSIQMAGGMAFGFMFPKFTRYFKDKLIAIAYLMLFTSLTMLNVFHSSLVMMSISVFLAGASMSLIGPHCVVAVSHCVDIKTSAIAASLVTGLAPGLGSFLSPVIFTNVTNALVKDSTNFRYQFVAVAALCFAVLFAIITVRRSKKEAGDARYPSESKIGG